MQHICAICAHPIEPVFPLENTDQEAPVLTDTNQFDDWEKIIIEEYPQVIALPFRKCWKERIAKAGFVVRST